eukprot:Nk52_evm1s951 gene=Nk52_evmTU1s951
MAISKIQSEARESLDKMGSLFERSVSQLSYEYDQNDRQIEDAAALRVRMDRNPKYEKSGVAQDIEDLLCHARKVYNYFCSLEASLGNNTEASLTKEIMLLQKERDAIDSALCDTKEMLGAWKGRLGAAMEAEAEVLLSSKGLDPNNPSGNIHDMDRAKGFGTGGKWKKK